MYHNIL